MLLKHYIESKKGDVIYAESPEYPRRKKGEVIGSHDGAIFFTLGERHGFKIFKNENNSTPLYVVSKDIDNNTITVSSSAVSNISKTGQNILCNNTNWIIAAPEKDKKYTAQVRYHGELLDCKVNVLDDKKVEIIFDKNVLVDKGQSIVVYDGDICLGGCIVA
ncbi:hypothetical protein HXX01_04415 [Candidatus Nomurabacteria bacterium]|nr:hypothetical protein [Candidatus Nomurabacteria bacterium]